MIGKLNAAGTLQWQATWSSTDSSKNQLDLKLGLATNQYILQIKLL